MVRASVSLVVSDADIFPSTPCASVSLLCKILSWPLEVVGTLKSGFQPKLEDPLRCPLLSLLRQMTTDPGACVAELIHGSGSRGRRSASWGQIRQVWAGPDPS